MQSAALIIEDDKLEAERLGELVTDQAWRAVICHDVASACRLLKLEPFQLLMIDLGLEKESALPHLRALRKRVPATPIAVMAAATRFH
ncbi:MAG: response regulator, partial [Asticcacaulis sp.]|nr:response regulator [Asticcacaulis sp.]